MVQKTKRGFYSLIHRIPHIKDLLQRSREFDKNSCFPPGHFYSPIVSVDDIKRREVKIWKPDELSEIKGIDLNVEQQLALTSKLSAFYSEMPFKKDPTPGLRYYFINDYYCYTESIILYSIMRHFNPRNIIEVGSGFSSAVMLDTNDMFLNHQTRLTFIEPFPDRLNSLLTEKDKLSVNIVTQGIQSVDLNIFNQLQKDDILFIDSTHILKTGSDVNYILFEILPRLNEGVIIHFHDIYYPFEYPKKWVFEGRNWNETYALRSFLTYNRHFEILHFSDYLHRFYPQAFNLMPLTYQNTGSSFWLRKVMKD